MLKAFLALLVLAGLGWLYGGRLVSLSRLAREVAELQAQERQLLTEIDALEGQLATASDPAVVEAWARNLLGWGYPDEFKLIVRREAP